MNRLDWAAALCHRMHHCAIMRLDVLRFLIRRFLSICGKHAACRSEELLGSVLLRLPAEAEALPAAPHCHLHGGCMCSLDRTMESLWEDGRRLVFVSSVPCEGQCLWWPPGTVHNSYANSDTLEVMWFYNRGILEDYRLNATQLFKCAVHAADGARLTHHCIAHHLVAQQRLLADAADNVSLHSPLTQLFAG